MPVVTVLSSTLDGSVKPMTVARSPCLPTWNCRLRMRGRDGHLKQSHADDGVARDGATERRGGKPPRSWPLASARSRYRRFGLREAARFHRPSATPAPDPADRRRRLKRMKPASISSGKYPPAEPGALDLWAAHSGYLRKLPMPHLPRATSSELAQSRAPSLQCKSYRTVTLPPARSRPILGGGRPGSARQMLPSETGDSHERQEKS